MYLNKILNKKKITFDDICYLLALEDLEQIEQLRQKAENILLKNIGNKISLRGLIEFSNYCIKDCLYCGIRKSITKNIERFILTKNEVITCVDWALKKQFGSIVLQAGERTDKEFINYVLDIINTIKKISISDKLPNGLGITLSVGEQTEETYKRFFDSGAHRYLLRIETTNETLFSQIHPKNQLFSNRLNSLKILRNIGFQVGTGVMIGLPNQTIEDLAKDILFFKEMDIDMIGMGPFIPHNDTPFANVKIESKTNFLLGLKMIAVLRLVMPYINIASTTALETLNDEGRTLGLLYGANVVMPQLTPINYKNNYILYNNKPDIDETQDIIFEKMVKNLENINRKILINQWGDSLHFKNRLKK